MLHGLFLDPRVWKIDLQSSSRWDTEKYGIRLDLHLDAFHIPKIGIDKKYKFVLTTEVWEIPMRKTLEYLRKKGLKIILMPRETFITDDKRFLLFGYPKFLYNGEYYFMPDVVAAPNKVYAGFWKDKTDVVVTGYPRFDYLSYSNNADRRALKRKYGIATDKKIIFFPSFPPYYYKDDGTFFDIYDGREMILQTLEKFVKNNPGYQVVSKIHPMSFKCYKKGTGPGREVAGTLLKYYKSPTEYMKVIGDVRMSGDASKDLSIIADIVVGFTSTMLLESLALDKSVMHLQFGNTANVKFTAYEDYLPTAYAPDDLVKFLKSPYKTKDKRLVEDYLYLADGKSCGRICETIINILKDDTRNK